MKKSMTNVHLIAIKPASGQLFFKKAKRVYKMIIVRKYVDEMKIN